MIGPTVEVPPLMTVAERLREHVTPDLEYVYRVYLNGYTPAMQGVSHLL